MGWILGFLILTTRTHIAREIDCKGNMNLNELLDTSGLLPDLTVSDMPEIEIEDLDLKIDFAFFTN